MRRFVAEAGERLRDEDPANMVLLRGFARLPSWPAFPDATGLRAAALADYSMYRGVARLIGMESLDPGHSMAEKIDRAREAWERFDFFFLHHKSTDAAGEDGDFERKMREIEKIDAALPALLALHPDVLVVTGDHSTPSSLAAHSWHPVPVVLWSPRCRPDRVGAFGERECMAGGLGPRLPATDLMPLVLAHAERLDKFGA